MLSIGVGIAVSKLASAAESSPPEEDGYAFDDALTLIYYTDDALSEQYLPEDPA